MDIAAVTMSDSPFARAAEALNKPPTTVQAVTVKGFYLSAVVNELANQGHHLGGHKNYRDFVDYPIAAAHELLDACAERLYPHERRPEAMRRVGWIIYPTLLSTVVGAVTFGSLGNDLPAVLRVAARGFDISISRGRYEAVHIGNRDAHVRVREFPLYPESFLRGIFEGVFAHYGLDGRVEVRALSPSDVDLHLAW
jgi:uncharacterized protein (TIGR02265 family)